MATTTFGKIDSEKVLSSYEPFFNNGVALLLRAKKGLKPNAVFEFVELSGLPQQIIEGALSKNMKTFQNYLRKNILLDASTSEKLLKLFGLYRKGIQVFGSVPVFAEWLSKPAYGLGNTIPQDIIDTATGIDLVKEELVRIEFGDLA